ncbi:MAG: nucleotidyltransferase family protein [Bacteroidaceae bacterium]|nr:nucleotidyltransferase family protein [Bacteroidaceae bacterium]
MVTNLQEYFLQLVRLGIGTSNDVKIPKDIDWVALKALAERQGLTAVVLDGIDRVQEFNGSSVQDSMPQMLRLEWIGEVLQNYEERYRQYEKAIGSLAGFYNAHGFKMMVLKGYACSLDWPKSEHRPCGDIDIWLFGKQKEADAALEAWFKGSKVQGFKIDGSHHHHTVFEWQGFTVENHYDFVNVHAHNSSKELEKTFKELGDVSHIDNKENISIPKSTKITSVLVHGEKVYLPSPDLHALFLIKHMVSHFAAAQITLRQLLDWAFFVEKNGKDVDWEWLMTVLEKYHMKDFFNLINAICVDDLGFRVDMFPTVQFLPELKDRVLADILEPAYGTAEPRGFFKRMTYKYRRWQGNAWKQRLCYDESRWSAFWSGVWGHLLKPKSI